AFLRNLRARLARLIQRDGYRLLVRLPVFRLRLDVLRYGVPRLTSLQRHDVLLRPDGPDEYNRHGTIDGARHGIKHALFLAASRGQSERTLREPNLWNAPCCDVCGRVLHNLP